MLVYILILFLNIFIAPEFINCSAAAMNNGEAEEDSEEDPEEDSEEDSDEELGSLEKEDNEGVSSMKMGRGGTMLGRGEASAAPNKKMAPVDNEDDEEDDSDVQTPSSPSIVSKNVPASPAPRAKTPSPSEEDEEEEDEEEQKIRGNQGPGYQRVRKSKETHEIATTSWADIQVHSLIKS